MNEERETAAWRADAVWHGDGSPAVPGMDHGPSLDEEPEVGMARERDLVLLDAAAADWMLGLPLDVRPSCTAAWYPHVVNRLCVIWPERKQREAYFSALLFSQREGRRGFEALVVEELFELQHFGLTACAG